MTAGEGDEMIRLHLVQKIVPTGSHNAAIIDATRNITKSYEVIAYVIL